MSLANYLHRWYHLDNNGSVLSHSKGCYQNQAHNNMAMGFRSCRHVRSATGVNSNTCNVKFSSKGISFVIIYGCPWPLIISMECNLAFTSRVDNLLLVNILSRSGWWGPAKSFQSPKRTTTMTSFLTWSELSLGTSAKSHKTELSQQIKIIMNYSNIYV